MGGQVACWVHAAEAKCPALRQHVESVTWGKRRTQARNEGRPVAIRRRQHFPLNRDHSLAILAASRYSAPEARREIAIRFLALLRFPGGTRGGSGGGRARRRSTGARRSPNGTAL